MVSTSCVVLAIILLLRTNEILVIDNPPATPAPPSVCQTPDDAAHVLPSSDPTAHLLPNKIKDFTAFINLVDFCR